MLYAEHNSRGLGIVKTLDRSQLLKGAVIKLQPARRLKITVSDVYGKPLPGAEVSALATLDRTPMPIALGRTGSTGALVARRIYNGGQYDFAAKLTGYRTPGVGRLPIVGSENWIDFVEIVMERATSR